jgi:hypothetical protein
MYYICEASEGWHAEPFKLGWNAGGEAASHSRRPVERRSIFALRRSLGTLYNERTFLPLFAKVFNVLYWANYGYHHGFIAPEADDSNLNFGKPTGTIGPPLSVQLGEFYVL